MPFNGFEDFDGCVSDMMQAQGYDKETAERVCGKLQEELKEGHRESVKEILSNLKQGAKAILEDLKLDIVSAVETPAQPSNWVMMKSEDTNKWSSDAPIFISKQDDESETSEEKQIAYAPALVPGVSDREGDIVPASEIEKAAHSFVKNQRNDSIDTDHDLMTGKGNVVESWILKEDRSFTLPSGESKEYKKGTWMLGIEFEDKAWKRIKDGDLTGLSIYGRSEEIDLEKQSSGLKDLNNEEKQSNDITSSNKNDLTLLMSEIMSEKEQEKEEEPKTEEIEFTEKEEQLFEEFQEIKESIKELNTKLETSEKEDTEDEDDDEYKQEIEDMTDAIDWLEDNAPEEIVNMVVDAVRSNEAEEEEEEEMSTNDEKETEEETEPNTGKGYDGEGVRQKNLSDKQKNESNKLNLPNRKEVINKD